MKYRPTTYDELVKAFKYAKRLLEESKYGILLNITEKKQQRSTKQNNYYHGVLVAMIADEEGYAKHNRYMVHEALKEMFCPSKQDVLGVRIKSTKLLNTAEMEVYEEDIRLWYKDFNEGYMLPKPNEV